MSRTPAVSRVTLQPQLIVDTTFGVRREAGRVVVNNHETVVCSLKMAPDAKRKRIPLEALTVPAGKTAAFFVLYVATAIRLWPAP